MSPPSKLAQWPNQPAKRGEFYGVQDPVFQKDELCVMLMETWVDVGTLVKKQEQTMKTQHETIVALRVEMKVLISKVHDAEDRLENLRRVRRREKRKDIEKEQPELSEAARQIDMFSPYKDR